MWYTLFLKNVKDIVITQLLRYSFIEEFTRYEHSFSEEDLNLFHLGDNNLKVRSFFVSFSENRDDLYQWNSYCNGGNGIAIGFDYHMLASEIEKSKRSSLIRVNYLKKHKKGMKQELSKMFDEAFTTIDKLTSETALNEYTNKFLGKVAEFIFSIKAENFQAEKEFRLVSLHSDIDEIKFRNTQRTLIPYCTFDFKENKQLISEIIIGPTLDFEYNVN